VLPIRRYSARPLLPRIWELRHTHTAYDASYVALAEALAGPAAHCRCSPGTVAWAQRADRAAGGLKVCVLTTSYPRGPEDPAGRFVADAVEHVRARGIEVEVVHPTRHYGIAYGHGIVGNLRARPWLVPLVPAFLWNLRRAVPRDADLVHAHWLAAGAVAATLRTPFVVQVWGTDLELARRVPWLARWNPAPGEARDRRVDVPGRRGAPAGRAGGRGDPERRRGAGGRGRAGGAAARAVRGPPVAGEGHRGLPRRQRRASRASSWAPARCASPRPWASSRPRSSGRWYERAAVVCVPSRREGYGVVAREAMAWGRPVVATAVGGLRDLDVVLVPPGDRSALRGAIERLLGDAEERVATRRGGAGTGAVLRRRDGRAARGLPPHDVVLGTSTSIFVFRNMSIASCGACTIGSFSLNDVFSRSGTSVSRRNSSISR